MPVKIILDGRLVAVRYRQNGVADDNSEAVDSFYLPHVLVLVLLTTFLVYIHQKNQPKDFPSQ